MTDGEEHWENVYRSKRFDEVSWYAPHLADSLRVIEQLCPDRAVAVVDIGSGESTLVDDLLQRHYVDISVLDISATAIEFTRQRLGARAAGVTWHIGDITKHDFAPKTFDLWHDRAVFHFLTEPSKRRDYVELASRSIKPGGFLLMATFGPNGPLKCSGLDVVRYSEERCRQEFGTGFEFLGSELSHHRTPMGTSQQFLYCWLRRTQ